MKRTKYKINSKKHIFIHRSEQGIRATTLKLVPIHTLAEYHGMAIIRIIFGMALVAVGTHISEETLDVVNHFNATNK